jgi:hypothetical protein
LLDRREAFFDGRFKLRVRPLAVIATSADSGIVDQNVDLAVSRDGRVGCRSKLGLERHIGANTVHNNVGASQTFKRHFERSLCDITEHHLDARLCERNAETNSGQGPGRERSLRGQVPHMETLEDVPTALVKFGDCGRRPDVLTSRSR